MRNTTTVMAKSTKVGQIAAKSIARKNVILSKESEPLICSGAYVPTQTRIKNKLALKRAVAIIVYTSNSHTQSTS